MATLKNSQHERFCQLIAKGELGAGSAYKKAFPKCKKNSARTLAARLAKVGEVKDRIMELQKETAKKALIEIEDVLKYAIAVMNTPVGDVSKTHKLCQEYSETTGEMSSSVRFKMPDKLAAMEKIIKIMGWYAPEKQEHQFTGDNPIIVHMNPIVSTPPPNPRRAEA